MTTSQSWKSANRARRLSTGHGRACPDIRQLLQIAPQSTEFDTTRSSLISRFTLIRLDRPTPSQSNGSPAALKYP